MGGSGSIPSGGNDIFPFSAAFRPALGPTKLPIQWVPGAFPVGMKRQGRETDHAPPSGAEFKDKELYLHSSLRLHGAVRNKA
jgi:hypothetical protein